jgi:hypothetical protein
MSDNIRPSRHERRVGFHGEAPFAKHDYRYRSRNVIRLAGKVWAEDSNERQRRLNRERLKDRMRKTPVGLGFGVNDNYGPDDTYHTIEFIDNRHDQQY